MRKVLLPVFILPVLAALWAAPGLASMSSTSFQIPISVMSSGGGSMASTSFAVSATVGQSSPPGAFASSGYELNTGFWYTAILSVLVGDVNGDGFVNLEDVIVTLQIITGQTSAEISLAADVNGDGKIGIVEAIVILRKLGGL